MPKLIFANQLRGLAAICVAGSHLVGAFWIMRDFLSLATATPVQGGTPPGIVTVFLYPWFNFGPFGVGVFFLISGLVIPISLEQHTRGSFMLARLLRIYPTYIVALLLEVIVLHASAAYWGKPFPYGNWTIISNTLLIYNAVGQPSIDMVNWTLCVELKFYLLMMLLAPQIRRGSVTSVLLVALVIAAGNTIFSRYPLAGNPTLHDLAGQFSIESTFLIFMLIGVLFNFRLRGLLSPPAFAGGCIGMIALFLVSWSHSVISDQVPIVTVNYLYALILFAGLFFLRGFARPIRLLDFMASISFPFYLIHALLGYSILKILMLRIGLSYVPAVVGTIAVVVCVSAALHLAIEVRTIAMGRRLGRRHIVSAAPPLTPRRISPA